MKRAFLLAALLLALALAPAVCAQYESYADQMVRDNINLRRATEARRPSVVSKSKGTGTKSRSASAKKAARPSVPLTEIALGQDLYSSFGKEDQRVFTLEVRLSPVSRGGKPLVKRAQFAPSRGKRSVRIAGIPPGRYAASARVLDAGKNVIPVLLGTELGDPTNPNGGNFAPTQVAELMVGKDSYGNRRVSSRTLFWFRPQVQ
jgi:hypothetical protein